MPQAPSPVPSVYRPSAHAYWWACLFCVVFAAHYVAFEHPVYAWDARGYWEMYWQSNELLRQNIGRWLLEFQQILYREENNRTHTLFLLPFNWLFERHRLGFIEALVLTFMFPAMCLSWLRMRGYFETQKIPFMGAPAWALFMSTFCFSAFWIPSLRGFPDSSGLIFFTMAYWRMYRTDYGQRQSLRSLLLTALLLYLPFVMRKWYAYPVITLISVSLIFALRAFWKTGPNWARFKVYARNYCIMGLLIVVWLTVFQGRLSRHILETDYADIFVAYQTDTWQHPGALLDHFGGGVLLSAFLGACYGLRQRITRHLTAFTGLCAVGLYVFFTSTQAFGAQHYLPMALFFYIFCGLALWGLCARRRRLRIWASLGFVLLCFFSLLRATGLYTPPAWLDRTHLLPAPLYVRTQLENLETYRKLADDLAQTVKPRERFAVFASGGTLSDSLIHALLDEETDQRLLYINHIDARDHFGSPALVADYLLVGDPIRTHLPAEHQMIVTEPAKQLLAGTGIGAAYQPVARYAIAQGDQAILYKRLRNLTEPELRQLFEAFFTRYPKWRTLYSPFEMSFLLSERHLPGPTADASMLEQDLLHLRPAIDAPTSVRFTVWPTWSGTPSMHSGLQRFRLRPDKSMKRTCPDFSGVTVRFEKQDGDALTLLEDKRLQWDQDTFVDFSPEDFAQLKVSVLPSGRPQCDQATLFYRPR